MATTLVGSIVVDDSIVQLLSLAIIVIPAAIASIVIEPKRQRKAPATRPYTWGLYISLQQSILGFVMLLGALFALLQTAPGEGILLGILGAGLLACGSAGYKREKWGFVACAILSLNPIAWIVNFIYGKNRWDEFAAEDAARSRLETTAVQYSSDAPQL